MKSLSQVTRSLLEEQDDDLDESRLRRASKKAGKRLARRTKSGLSSLGRWAKDVVLGNE